MVQLFYVSTYVSGHFLRSRPFARASRRPLPETVRPGTPERFPASNLAKICCFPRNFIKIFKINSPHPGRRPGAKRPGARDAGNFGKSAGDEKIRTCAVSSPSGQENGPVGRFPADRTGRGPVGRDGGLARGKDSGTVRIRRTERGNGRRGPCVLSEEECGEEWFACRG